METGRREEREDGDLFLSEVNPVNDRLLKIKLPSEEDESNRNFTDILVGGKF